MRFIDKENTPNDWTSQKISHYVEEHKGGAPLKPSDFSESGFSVIPKKAIQQGNKLVITAPTFCTKSFADKNTRSIVDTNYTITTLRDLVPTGPTIGTVVNFYSDEQYILSQGVYGLKLKSNIDRDYFAYVSNASFYRKVMKRVMVGSTQVHIRTPEYLSLEIQLPPLPEQRKIAKILSTWDKAISTTERLIDNSKQQKKALMQQLLTGKKRLLDDSGKPFEGEWVIKKLSDLFTFSTASSKSKFIDNEGENYILDMGSVSITGKLIPTKKTKISKDFLSKGQLVMPKDDIGGGQIIGRVGYVDNPEKYVLSDHVYCLTPKSDCSLFLSYLINHHDVNKGLRRRANGTAQLGLGKKDAEKQPVFMPKDITEQQKIASVLINADKEIELLEQQLADLKQEKKALMQQLLTGKRRVKVDDKEVV